MDFGLREVEIFSPKPQSALPEPDNEDSQAQASAFHQQQRAQQRQRQHPSPEAPTTPLSQSPHVPAAALLVETTTASAIQSSAQPISMPLQPMTPTPVLVPTTPSLSAEQAFRAQRSERSQHAPRSTQGRFKISEEERQQRAIQHQRVRQPRYPPLESISILSTPPDHTESLAASASAAAAAPSISNSQFSLTVQAPGAMAAAAVAAASPSSHPSTRPTGSGRAANSSSIPPPQPIISFKATKAIRPPLEPQAVAANPSALQRLMAAPTAAAAAGSAPSNRISRSFAVAQPVKLQSRDRAAAADCMSNCNRETIEIECTPPNASPAHGAMPAAAAAGAAAPANLLQRASRSRTFAASFTSNSHASQDGQPHRAL